MCRCVLCPGTVLVRVLAAVSSAGFIVAPRGRASCPAVMPGLPAIPYGRYAIAPRPRTVGGLVGAQAAGGGSETRSAVLYLL